MILSLGGDSKFYFVSGDDAILIHYFMKYKFKRNKYIIFPKESISKIINILKEKGINYKVGNGVTYLYTNNKYKYYKELAYENLMIEERIDLIIKKIEKLHGDELKKLLNNIENILNE